MIFCHRLIVSQLSLSIQFCQIRHNSLHNTIRRTTVIRTGVPPYFFVVLAEIIAYNLLQIKIFPYIPSCSQ